jgi:acid phosphatase type 7
MPGPLFFGARRGAVSFGVATGRQRLWRRGRVVATAAIAVLLAALALVLPDSCTSNELGHIRAPRGGDLSLGPAPRGEQGARFARACPGGGLARAPIRRAPYLQQVTDGAAEILWTADGLTDPQVTAHRAGQDAPITAPAAVDPSAVLPRGEQYVARLGGLAPATTYCYEVRDGARRLAGPFGFTTAPGPGAYPIRLVAFGDMGWRSGDQSAVLAQMSRVEFDLALLAGDTAYPEGTLAEFEHGLFSVYAPLMRSAPFFPASGNHEYLTAAAAPFRQVFSLPENGGPEGRERWYSFDWGDLHVVVLDSEMLVPAQARWLEADLARTRAPWVIAIFHRAPFSSGEHGPDLPTRKAFVPILTRHRVPLVITGHEHDYERLYPPGGVVYVVSGGGGRGTRRVHEGGEYSAFAAQVAHFVYIVIEGERLRLWAIDASGQTFDTATLARAPRPAGTIRPASSTP